MNRLRRLLLTITACVAASVGLVFATSTPAQAGTAHTFIYGSAHPYYVLGEGLYDSEAFEGYGAIRVKDTYCDGQNGIIASVYWKNYNEWKWTDTVRVRGCGQVETNRTENIPEDDGVAIKFHVCKFLPDGTWKDCVDRFTWT